MKARSASSREKPKVVWVRSFVPNEKNSASCAISPAAKAQHRVGLVQLLDSGQDLLSLGQSRGILARVLEVGRLAYQLFEARQELMKRRVDEPDDHRQPRHLLEDALEVTALHR